MLMSPVVVTFVVDAENAAFDALMLLMPPRDGRALLLQRSGRPFAWHGRLLVPLDTVREPAGVIASPFYLVAYAVASRGADRAIATLLLHAEPPANRMNTPLDAEVAAATGAQEFIYAEPEAAAIYSEAVVVVPAERAGSRCPGRISKPKSN